MDYSTIETFTRHGGAYNRGAADSWYQREMRPHLFTGDTYNSPEVTADQMTDEEIAAYRQGYMDNEASGCHKEY